jgi:hypothetical protein
MLIDLSEKELLVSEVPPGTLSGDGLAVLPSVR